MALNIAESKEAVRKALLEEEPKATEIKVHEEFTEFVGNSVYYVEFKTPKGDQSDNFYYAMMDKNGHVQLLDDGVTALRELKDELDKSRTFLQRFNEFSLVEMVAGAIALIVTIAFVVLCVVQKEVNPQFLGIFGIVIGYYFGKNTK